MSEMKFLRNAAIIMLVMLGICFVTISIVYKTNTDPVDAKATDKIEVVIPPNSSVREVGDVLKDKGLIKNSNFFVFYLKLFPLKDGKTLKAGTYFLSKSMNIDELIEVICEGNNTNADQIKVRFNEGISIKKFASVVAEKTTNKEEDVYKVLSDSDFLDELINKYWFLDNSIKDEKQYYSLEGYLFPDTYYFANKNVEVKDIIIKMLNREEEILNGYKDDIANSKYSVRDIIIMASIVEKEGKRKDFDNIASVFYNRLSSSMRLESCATLYYGAKKEFSDVGIATSEMMQDDNPYNTYMYDGLPVGPISLPSKEAIEAAVKPSETDNLYFLSDNKGNTYFFKTYSEHQAKQRELEKAGLWLR
jgi:UPF0755 protein